MPPPTLHECGKVQDKTVGAVTKAELEEKLKALL